MTLFLRGLTSTRWRMKNRFDSWHLLMHLKWLIACILKLCIHYSILVADLWQTCCNLVVSIAHYSFYSSPLSHRLNARLCWHAANNSLSTCAAKFGLGEQHEVCWAVGSMSACMLGFMTFKKETAIWPGSIINRYQSLNPTPLSSLSPTHSTSLNGLVGLWTTSPFEKE